MTVHEHMSFSCPVCHKQYEVFGYAPQAARRKAEQCCSPNKAVLHQSFVCACSTHHATREDALFCPKCEAAKEQKQRELEQRLARRDRWLARLERTPEIRRSMARNPEYKNDRNFAEFLDVLFGFAELEYIDDEWLQGEE